MLMRDLNAAVASCALRSVGVAAAVLLVSLPALAQTAAYPDQLPAGPNCDMSAEGGAYFHPSVAAAATGKGAAIIATNLVDSAGVKDLFLVWHDRSNFVYTHTSSIQGTGAPQSWRTPVSIGGAPPPHNAFGHWNIQNMSAAVGDIDGNGVLDLLLVMYASFDSLIGTTNGSIPPHLVRTPNKFYYRIGWNLDGGGNATSWSGFQEVAGVDTDAQGVGAALADIDGDARLDLVLLAYATSPWKFRYRIGFGMRSDGTATSWAANYVSAPGFLEPPVVGAGVVVADIDLDGVLDILLLAYTTENAGLDGRFRYRVGWSLGADGKASRWSRDFHLRALGPSAAGAGVALGRLFSFDASGSRFYRPYLFTTSRVATGAGHQVRMTAMPLTTSGAPFGSAEDYLPPYPYTRPNVLSVPSSGADQTGEKLFNLNMSMVQSAAWDALASFLTHCQAQKAAGVSAPECAHQSLPGAPNVVDVVSREGFSIATCPDLLVAAVAWYVDQNMGYTGDGANGYVLNDIFNLGYAPGGEGMPAYYIVRYTDPTINPNLIAQLAARDAAWAQAYNDGKIYHGDCEDFAILRHALLRVLSFDRRFVWNAHWLGQTAGHEFNVVLYGGSYRVMDYGPINSYLCCSNGWGIKGAWNEMFGPRINGQNESYYRDYVFPRGYPDRCMAQEWSFTRLARPESDNSCECCR
jgi:hypothetical protein